MTARPLALAEARGLAVAGPLLDGSAPGTVAGVVAGLGSVQVDPVAAVARAEQMALFSRLGPYDTGEIAAAIARGEVFEYHAFLLPTADFGLHRPTMRRYPAGNLTRPRYIRQWLAQNAAFRRYVLRELRRRGPLRSRDLEDRHVVPWQTGGWSDGAGLSRMLDALWDRGEITIVARDGNERVWDLAARHLPVDEPAWTPRQVARRAVESALRVRGVARRPGLGRLFDGVPRGSDAAFEGLVREGVAVPVSVDGLPGEWWAHRDVLERRRRTPRTVLLSPFDKLVADRDRALALFGFDYRLEMYVTPAKREYGYYVLPILHDERLVGRLDPVHDRRAGVLRLNGIWAERGASTDAGPPIRAAIDELAGWLGATEVELPRRLPRAWARALRAG